MSFDCDLIAIFNMSFYSGPPRDRPEALHSGFTKNLCGIIAICTFTAILFLGAGLAELINPLGKLEGAQLYATIGIGFAAVLVALWSYRALQKEYGETSPVYVEFRNKQIRNILVRGEIHFLLQDIVNIVYSTPQEASAAMMRLARGPGCQVIDGKPFLSLDAIAAFLSTRDDRTSILLMREMKSLIFTRDKRKSCG